MLWSFGNVNWAGCGIGPKIRSQSGTVKVTKVSIGRGTFEWINSGDIYLFTCPIFAQSLPLIICNLVLAYRWRCQLESKFIRSGSKRDSTDWTWRRNNQGEFFFLIVCKVSIMKYILEIYTVRLGWMSAYLTFDACYFTVVGCYNFLSEACDETSYFLPICHRRGRYW